MTRQSVSTTAAGIAGRSHAARSRPRARSRSPSRGARRRSRRRSRDRRSASSSASTPSLIALDRRAAHDVDHAAHTVAEPDEIPLVGKHVELDDRVDVRVVRASGGPRRARTPASPRRSADRRRARRRSGPTAPNQIICMSFGPASAEARRVAQHRAEDRRVDRRHPALGLQRDLEAGCRGVFLEVRADRQAVVDARCRIASRIAGEWIAPALTITSRASISSPPAVRTPAARRPSNSTRSTSMSPRTSRFERAPRRLEVRVVRRDAPAVAQRERHATDAGRVAGVVVVAHRVAEIRHRRAERHGRAAAARRTRGATAGSARPCRADRRRRSRGRPRPAGTPRASPAIPSPGIRAPRPNARSRRRCRGWRPARSPRRTRPHRGPARRAPRPGRRPGSRRGPTRCGPARRSR